MNQILVTQKIYVTPELKRKKKFYKLNFLLSILFIGILITIYFYTEYDRNRYEQVSQMILFNTQEENQEDDNLVVTLDKDNQEQKNNNQKSTSNSKQQNIEVMLPHEEMVVSGVKCEKVATINIPKLNKTYPILQGDLDKIDTLLKTAPCKFRGGEPNEVGNFSIVGHNYRNDKFFSKLKTLAIGDTIELTDLSNRTITYEIYDKHTVDPKDVSDTEQLTNGKKEVTLITCTDDSVQRLILRTREVK